MKKRLWRPAALLLALGFLLGSLTGCKKREEEKEGILPTEDKMRTYYQIFPYAFADSNGDGVGDLQGIIAKLDYIDGLHYDGLWLTPVHPSPTYHKYDVTDYYDIDSVFGTLEDYDALIAACHERGMTVLLDLVINHSAKDHPWFKKCAAAQIKGKTDDPYYSYYNFRKLEKGESIPGGWERFESYDWIYECRFWSGMPDLNLQSVLDNPEGPLAQEITSILKFWLIDHDVDGFRLDAVTSYFTNDEEKNLAFLTWLNKTAKEIKPDCYIVGEGAWGNPGENQRYQASGIDSFFAFQHGYTANGNLSYAARLGKAAYLYLIDEDNAEISAPGIPATFISNHDTGRAYGIAMAAAQPDALKTIFGLMAMCYGPTFSYYGDEVGMSVLSAGGTQSSYKDEDKRQPMPWGDEYECKPVKGSTEGTREEKYPYGTVAEQEEDETSLLNYIRRANAIRRAYPQIARYQAVSVYVNFERDLCLVSKGEGAEKIYILWNASLNQSRTYDLSQLEGSWQVGATLSNEEIPSVKGGVVTMPPQTFAIIEPAA